MRFHRSPALAARLAGATIILAAVPVSAVPDIADDAAVAMDEFEIVTDRAPAADNSEIEQRRLHSTEPFTGITRAEFGRRANRRAGDIIARLPGVSMGGAPGESNDVQLRGLDKEFTRTQIDGLPLPDGGEKREFQLNRLPSDLVQEVRILRAPTPEFESDGLAGRVDLRFRTIPNAPLSLDLRAGGGERNRESAARWTASATAGGRFLDNRFGWLGSFNFLEDPIYKRKLETQFSAAGAATKTVNETERKPTTARDFFGDFAWFHDAGELHIKPLRLALTEAKEKTKETIDHAKPAASDATVDVERETKEKRGSGLTVTDFRHFGASGPNLDTQLSWQLNDEAKTAKVTDSFKESAGNLVLDKRTTETEDKEDEVYTFSSKLTAPLGADLRHIVKTGASVRARTRFRSKVKTEQKGAAGTPVNKTGAKDNYDLDENYYALFAQDTWRATERLTLTGGARFEHVDLTGRTPTTTDVDADFDDLNPSLQSLYRLRDDTALKLSVSRALNRPKFDELSPYEQTDGNKVVIGNPALEPARAWKFDAGIDHRRENLFLGLAVYHQEIKGVIEQVSTGYTIDNLPAYQVQNVGDGWVQGVEFEQRIGFRWAHLRALNGLTLWANQTWLRSELTTANGTTRRFNGQPRFLANLGIDYEVGRLYVTASSRYRGRRPGDEASQDTKIQDDELLTDAALHFRLAKGLTVFVEANNLTDEKKVETTLKADGTRTEKSELTGRAWIAGLHYRF